MRGKSVTSLTKGCGGICKSLLVLELMWHGKSDGEMIFIPLSLVP